eukprot:9825115-Alexandrium_andersonii.AAC.1
MSASLVGSEMCIRDRWARSTARARCGLRQHRPCATSRLKKESDADVSEAVSYTHLTLPTICSV